MRLISSLCVVMILATSVLSQESDNARGKAAALLNLARQRHSPVVLASASTDLSGFIERPADPDLRTGFLAALEGRQLFIFVGGCSEQVRRAFPDCAHLSVPSYRGAADRRVIVPKDGTDYYWLEGDVTAAAVQQLLGVSRSAARDGSPRCEEGECELNCENGTCSFRRPAVQAIRRGRSCAGCQ